VQRETVVFQKVKERRFLRKCRGLVLIAWEETGHGEPEY